MNVQFLKEITDPREIVDKKKYRYFYRFRSDCIEDAYLKNGTRIQNGFSNKINGGVIRVYKELINKKIIKRII